MAFWAVAGPMITSVLGSAMNKQGPQGVQPYKSGQDQATGAMERRMAEIQNSNSAMLSQAMGVAQQMGFKGIENTLSKAKDKAIEEEKKKALSPSTNFGTYSGSNYSLGMGE